MSVKFVRSLIKRHCLFFVACILFFSSCAKQSDPMVVTVDFSGEESKEQVVTITFSHPVVDEKQIGKPADGIVEFSPKIDGKALWKDDRTLIFIPSQKLALSSEYSVVFSPNVKSLDNRKPDSKQTLKFQTVRIEGELVLMGSPKRALAKPAIRVSFTQPVPFEQISQKCDFQTASASHRLVLEEGQSDKLSKSYRVVPSTDLTLDTDWSFVCAADIRGSEGSLGTAEKITLEFHTFGPMRYLTMKPTGNDVVPSEDLRLEIHFTNPPEKPYAVRIEPAVKGFPENCHMLGGEDSGLGCAAMLEAHTSYRVYIDLGQKDVFGQNIEKEAVAEFSTSDAAPTVSTESGYFVAELKRPVLPIWTRNVSKIKVTAVEITPNNFHKMNPLLDWWNFQPVDFSTTNLKPVKKNIDIAQEKNLWYQYPFDPAQLFKKQPGPGMYYIEIGAPEAKNGVFSYENGCSKALLNFTDIGVVTKLSPSRGLVWATSLSTGKPLQGAQVSVRNSKGKVTWKGITDQLGIAYLPPKETLYKVKGAKALREANEEEENDSERLDVFVSYEQDWTMVNALLVGALSTNSFSGVWPSYSQTQIQLRGYIHTDRGLYRPGDTVHVKGIVRESSLGRSLAPPKKQTATVTVTDPRGSVLETREETISEFGGFWFDVNLPKESRLGEYQVSAQFEHGVFSGSFSVEEFRPSSFEVKAKADKRHMVKKGNLSIGISADYYYGAPVRDGNAEVFLHSRPASIYFDKFKDFHFRDWYEYEDYHSGYTSQSLITEETASLDKNGTANLAFSINAEDINYDADLIMQVNVTSSSNERVGKPIVIPYYKYNRYMGIKANDTVWEAGQPYKFEVAAVSPNGEVAKGKADVQVIRQDYNCVWEDWGYRGTYKCNTIEENVFKETVTFAGKPVELSFVPQKGGDYIISVDGKKDADARSSMNVYVYGEGGSYRINDSMTFDIITDKKEYRIGDIAKLILKTDLVNASGLITIERDGIVESKVVEVNKNTRYLELPIEESFSPNIFVSAVLTQPRMGEGTRGKPILRMGMVNLSVIPKDNKLNVSVKTDKKDYRPGELVTATVKITNSEGMPVRAEAAITAADEGVLSLIAYKTPDPTNTFWAPWGLGVSTATQYAYIKDIPGPNLERPATGGDVGGPGSARSRFMACPVWIPGAITDNNGIAKVTFEAPDNLTAFRVMAIAADKGYRFGSSDKRFTTSKPLQLHQALPRFMTVGDKMRGGAVVHNETDSDGEAVVKLIHNNIIASTDGVLEQKVLVPKGARVPVLFNLKAQETGVGELTFSVDMNNEKDAVIFKLPVHHQSRLAKKTVAEGSTKSTLEIPVSMPKEAIPSTVELWVSVDPNGLSGIEEGLGDLIGYPYGCLEQTSSKVIPMLQVGNLAEMLNLKELPKEKISEFVTEGIAKIFRHQTSNGGFSLWPGGEADAFYTAYALFALHLAQESGYKVDLVRIKDALEYLQYLGKQPKSDRHYYSEEGHNGNQAFSLYVRTVLKDADNQSIMALLEKGDNIPLYGKAFLLKALVFEFGKEHATVKKLYDELSKAAAAALNENRLIKEADSSKLSWYMSSDIRTSSIILSALVSVNPSDKIVENLAQKILRSRRSKAYLSTQDNVYSLTALTEFAANSNQNTPSVDVSLDGNSLISAKLEGPNKIMIASVPFNDSKKISLVPDGKVFYNVQLRYYEKPEHIKPYSQGLTLKRTYFDKNNMSPKKFKVRDTVSVRLEVSWKDSASHLMVSDRIPAGFEILNARLVTSGATEESNNDDDYYYGPSVYKEIRDERIDFASEYAWGSSVIYEYTMRATVPGRFILPPAIGELMYEPEIRVRTETDLIEIEE